MGATKPPQHAMPNNGWKTCSRSHKYRGAGPCPICWPGGTVRKQARKTTKPR